MVSLLDIPREVRQEILTLAVSDPRPPPSGYSNAGPRIELPDSQCIGWFDGRNVKHSAHMNRTKEFPTLLVNHQLHDETLDAIDILPTKHTYILDVMVVNGTTLWPTWLSIPELANSIDKVYTAIRVDSTSDMSFKGFKGGCGGPPFITWGFYHILERFLRIGPTVNSTLNNQGLISIKVLELDIKPPNNPRGTEIMPNDTDERAEYPYIRAKLEHMQRPDFMPEFLSSYIDILLLMTSHVAEFGSILYERIGTIRLLQNGQLYREWDMAQELRDVQFVDGFRHVPINERGGLFGDWRLKTSQKRALLGLSVLPLDEDRPTL